jgi:hypothetical protein
MSNKLNETKPLTNMAAEDKFKKRTKTRMKNPFGEYSNPLAIADPFVSAVSIAVYGFVCPRFLV